MATAQDLPTDADARELTRRRMRQMQPARGELRVVDDTGLPPGPRWPGLVQTVALLRFRHRFVPWAHRRYGDVFTVRTLPRQRPLVLFTRPEQAKQIFAGDPATFHAGKGNAILGPIMGAHSLLLQDGIEHQRARRLLMPAFNGHALRSYADLVGEVARAEIDRWHDGETFAALERMNALTLEVILRVVFGVTDEHRLGLLRPRVRQVVQISPVVLFGWSIPSLQRIGPWRAAVENSYELDRLILAEIRERRAADLSGRTDVLSRLVRAGAGDPGPDGSDADGDGDADGGALTDEELRDQLVTLLLAGHETTASALAWALYEIGRDAGVARRCREAASDAHEPGARPEDYLEAVLKESMRLHPVIPMVVRTLVEPATIGGYDLPAGATVGPSILLSHARADNHPNPQRFDPQRFLDGSPPTNTWIPFGGGVRRCIGAGFSLMEGVVVLRELLSRYDVVAAGADEPKVRNITSVPRHGARITVHAHRPRT